MRIFLTRAGFEPFHKSASGFGARFLCTLSLHQCKKGAAGTLCMSTGFRTFSQIRRRIWSKISLYPLSPPMQKGCRWHPLHWRRERDSNPRVLSHKLISSQPRYDHFDISPYLTKILYHTLGKKAILKSKKFKNIFSTEKKQKISSFFFQILLTFGF